MDSITRIKDFIQINFPNWVKVDFSTLEENIDFRRDLSDLYRINDEEIILISYTNISITGTERPKPQIRVFLDEYKKPFYFAKRHQLRFYLFSIFTKEDDMARGLNNFNPKEYIISIETNLDNEDSRRDLRSIYDYADKKLNGRKFLKCSRTNYKADINQASFIYIGTPDTPYKETFETFIDIFDSRPYLNSKIDLESLVKEPVHNQSTNPRQVIYYGAPGTGKSFEINKRTMGHDVIRTTFHPDSDYSTFVGAYKPTMEEVDSKVTPVVVANGIQLEKPGVYKEKRITYSFVKQAFLKAYLGAWKKYSLGLPSYATSSSSTIKVTKGSDTWLLGKVLDDRVLYTKESTIELKDYEKLVKDYWNTIKQVDDTENYTPGTCERYQATACLWYKNIKNQTIDHTADECWKSVEEELEKGYTISYIPCTRQTYSVSLRDGKVVVVSMASAKKDAIKRIFFEKSEKNGNSVQDAIAEKLKEYSPKSEQSSDIPEVFDELWNKLEEEVNQSNAKSSGSIVTNTIQPQFLIIEEINRGNCAQIFGDIFQLLDRSDNGFSSYPIEADSDLQQAIAEELANEDEIKLSQLVEGAVPGYKSNYGKTLSEDLQEGRILLLPPNLYIWATMNTSDQSLFPIDSAFKRRWDWEYIPIGYKNDNWIIKIGEKKYKWVDFQAEINKRIFGATESEDKQLGDFFVKADANNIISSKLLLNKVIFYLWNDVCKDGDGDIFKVNIDLDYSKELDPAKNEDLTFSKFFKDTDLKLKQWMRYLNIKPLEPQDDEDESHQLEEGVKPNEAKPDPSF